VKSYQNFLISHAARHAQNCFFLKKERRPLSSLGALLVAKLKRWRDVYLASSYFFFFFFKGNERRVRTRASELWVTGEIFLLFYNGKKKEEISYLGFHQARV